MNRSAYLTTSLAIKLFSRLSKADIAVHGKENIPTGPTIFVMNHFTRVETFLLPYYIFSLTGKPAWSLAASTLFKGGLGKFFDLVGVVSTSDPRRDELIVKSLLTGEANWIIFPEGTMVKTKKTVDGGKYMIAGAGGMHEPHTGAAALALRAELYRTYFQDTARKNPARLQGMLDILQLENPEAILLERTTIQPVNLTYYPIRTAENIASNIASKMVKDIPERMLEEIMTEGTMLLSGVDLDIRFGKPIEMADYLDDQWLQEDMEPDGITGYSVSDSLKAKMRKPAHDIMQKYMQDIYAMTTVNHEHLFASMLRKLPFKRIEEIDFKRRIFYGASIISNKEEGKENFFLHKSLKENQAHLLTDDRFKKYHNILELALEKGVVEKYGGYLIRDHSKLSVPLSFHKGRIDNPIEVMANEVEPLQNFQSIIRSLSWRPKFLLKLCLIRFILRQENLLYNEGRGKFTRMGQEKKMSEGKPLFYPSFIRRKGLVLVHSYLAVPQEVRALARYLRRRGVWVYAPRLPGHGTSAVDLSKRKYQEWFEAVENGFVLMSAICGSVVVGGVGVGGNMALDLAARVNDIAGAFAICPPFSLRNYTTRFMPGQDVWNRTLNKMRTSDWDTQFLQFSHGNLHVNYPRNPVAGIKQVGDYLESLEKRYGAMTQPALIIQADKNPVVDPKGSEQVYNSLASKNKEFSLLNYDRHVLINGQGAEKVCKKISDFIGYL